MDGGRFDGAAKALARGVSRRAVLRGLLGGVVATAAARALPSAACTPPGPRNFCNADSECCGTSRCLLGACTCPTGTKACGDRCIAQADTCGPSYCPAGFAACGTRCVDSSRDRANCGGCGRSCAVGQSCSNGRCCPKGRVFCDGRCKPANQCVPVA